VNLHQAADDEATKTNPEIIEELTGLPIFSLSPQAQATTKLPSWLSLRD